jgi:hypothetical protein
MFHKESDAGRLISDRTRIVRWHEFQTYRALGWRLGIALWMDDHVVKCRLNWLCDWVDREAVK